MYIRHKLTATLVALSTIPFVFVSFMAFVTVRNEIVTQKFHELGTLADLYKKRASQTTDTMVARGALRELVAEGLEQGETRDIIIGRKNEQGDAVFLVPPRFLSDPRATEVVSKDRKDVAITQALSGREENFTDMTDYRGVPVIAVTRFIPERGWGLVIKVDTSEVLLPLRNFRFALLILGGTSLLCCWILAILLAESLSRPVRLLTEAATAMATGSHSEQLNLIQQDDEIGVLARGFRLMQTQLGVKYEAYERQLRQRSAELIDIESRMRGITDALRNSALVSATDKQGTITYVNDKFVHVSKYRRAELLGRNHRILNSGDHPREFFDGLWKTVLSGSVWRGDVKNRAKDGSFFWVDTAIAPILNAEGEPAGFVSVRFLITDRKNEEIAKSQFISIASHQLRTPLGTIRWALESLRLSLGNNLPASQREDLDAAGRASESMMESIETLLLLSQIQAGKVGVTLSTISLSSLFEDFAASFRKQLGTRNQLLICDCPPGLNVKTDEKLLKEVLSSLLGNALKYSPDNSRIILRALEQQDMIRIEVVDSGMGIPAHEQSRVFSLYYRGENVLEAGIEGNGLGLSLVESLIRLLNGEVTFVSRQGKGTTFSLRLPVHSTR
ncbi:MAG: ATP-binding protein [Candidatus Peribacteraceae bacterium]|nr:ATP-binding protein [Candidatus Peribacteraceae bacterium]